MTNQISRQKPSKVERASRVLPISALTISILEARLFLELGIPPVLPGALRMTPFAGLLRDGVIRPLLQHADFLGLDSSGHKVVVRNAPWMSEVSPVVEGFEDYVPLFAVPAGWIVGSLLFRYLIVLTDESTFAHRSYRRAAVGDSLIIDVDAGQSTIQVYLPKPVSLAIGHAVASHYILGKSVSS